MPRLICHEGHRCCNDPDRHHSHFLVSEACPQCGAAAYTGNDVPLFVMPEVL